MSINPLPVKFPVAYHTTNVILPKIENELEVDLENEAPQKLDETNEEETTNEINTEENSEVVLNEESAKVEEEKPENTPVEVPAPNYTTTEAEKGAGENAVSFQAAENKPEIKNDVEIKKPEIIPGENIVPEVDIPLVISNLKSENYDVQAQQMEEIARISLDNPENAVPYIVREVFSDLIEISKKDTTNLAAPTPAQVDARKKLITNFIIIENSRQQNQKDIKLPYQITEEEFTLANELSPMEMAERNKEYALYTMAILTKVYTDEVEKQTGNVVPLTDLPGSAAMVDALRYSPNAGVKIAAIDALRYIQRKEYAEELHTLYSLAQEDPNPQVAMSAARALNQITKLQQQ